MKPAIPLLRDLREWDGVGVLSILGATGSGKTARALQWVETHFSEDRKRPLLVSVDAVAVWKGFDIGSAKPLGLEREPYDWAGLDILDAAEELNVARFVEAVLSRITKALAAHRPVLCVGGSHFYEQALLIGQSPGTASEPEFQKSLAELANAELAKRLERCDPRFSSKIHANDRYRLSRYLDLAERQSISYDDLFGGPKLHGIQSSCDAPIFRFLQGNVEGEAGEDWSLQLERRLDSMLESGWLEEIQSLLEHGVKADSPAFQSVGYREFLAHVLGRLSFEEARASALTAHFQLAKKQRTWLRGLLKKS